MNDKPTLLPPGSSDDTHGGAGPETRQEVRSGQTAPTVQHGPETHVEAEGSLEERIRRRLEASDEDERPKVDPLIGREIADRFQIYKKIGAGGMGAVYRARQKGMDRDVAIKVLLRELTENETVLRRFHIEALAVSKLRHPNTIQIFDFGETDDGLLYIAMEFLEGRPLQKLLKDEQQLAVRRALNIALQMARSLREAHSKGIVHRDLKPDNVLLEVVGEEQDFVKVLDFGVAKLAEGDGQQKTLTKAGSIFGTPKYMSPEQSRGGDIDARSDVYSIGVILYEMLTGRVPFNAENPLGILIKHLQELPPAFFEVRPDLVVPGPVEDFVMRLLAKDVNARPQTAEAVIREIEHLMAELPELFRRVVTREDAAAAGIEVATASRTSLDTDLGGTGPGTLGPFADHTVLHAPTAPAKRRKWPFIVIGALVLLFAGAGGLYASLAPLPAAYTEFTAIGDAAVGAVPEFDLKSVFVNIASDPAGADVVDDKGDIIGQTPFLLRRNQGAPAESYTFRKSGFEDFTRSFSFEDDAVATVKLLPVAVVAPPGPEVGRTNPDKVPDAVPPVGPGAVAVKPPVEGPATPPVDPKPEAVVKPPVEFNPDKVKDLKTLLFAPKPDAGPAKPSDLKPTPDFGS